jgi:hypothetical protein
MHLSNLMLPYYCADGEIVYSLTGSIAELIHSELCISNYTVSTFGGLNSFFKVNREAVWLKRWVIS